MNDDNDNFVTISPRQGFLPLGLFQNTYIKEYNYPTLFFSHLRPHISSSYQKIAQVDLTNVNKKIAYHFIDMFFKTIKKINSFYTIFLMDLYTERKISGTHARSN